MNQLLQVRCSAGYVASNPVLDGLEFSIGEGEAFGLVGESGAGKSTVGLALLNLLQWTGGWVTGEVRFRGQNLLTLREREIRRIRGKEIALVPQSPLASLNPALRLEAHFKEAWKVHRSEPWRSAQDRVMELLAAVQLPSNDGFLKRYPRELSVGMAQRLVIALALLHQPALVIADEPTSALDPVTQADILRLFADINASGSALLYISHDLPSVAALCARVAILQRGRVVEEGLCDEVFRKPAHPYAHRLIQAVAVWPPR
jgi:ABC-type dipeptide/oligopeptide/nickel transport system ATPase component